MQANDFSQLTSNAAGMAQYATHAYTQFQPRSAWDVITPIALAGIGGASSIPTGGLSRLGDGGTKLPSLRNNPVEIRTRRFPNLLLVPERHQRINLRGTSHRDVAGENHTPHLICGFETSEASVATRNSIL